MLPPTAYLLLPTSVLAEPIFGHNSSIYNPLFSRSNDDQETRQLPPSPFSSVIITKGPPIDTPQNQPHTWKNYACYRLGRCCPRSTDCTMYRY
ncbi:hypothetical protein GGS21DRAFT_501528 [Xylaria nigripes]|nr:hypothetical protein GGS21DRAFT_501528 [Xylaria nigripes]